MPNEDFMKVKSVGLDYLNVNSLTAMAMGAHERPLFNELLW
jgi:hypothetical protein